MWILKRFSQWLSNLNTSTIVALVAGGTATTVFVGWALFTHFHKQLNYEILSHFYTLPNFQIGFGDLPRSPRSPPSSPFWNTWFEDPADGQRVKVLKTAERGKIYSFVLDISRFPYFKESAVAVAPSVQKKISEAVERGDKIVEFTIRPILHGEVFRFAPNERSSFPLKVDLNKLRKLDKVTDEEIMRQYKEFLAGRKELRVFASEVQAGEVKFNLQAERPGNATISISIWDQSAMIPLDHLTLCVPVLKPNAEEVRQGSASQTIKLKGGLGTLLDVSLDFSSTGPLVADAAFYIFEPGPHRKSIVLFAGKTDPAGRNHEQDVSVRAWETESLLSQYIEERGQLLVQIKEARKLATETKQCYQRVADELKEKIFSGHESEDKKQAAEAEGIFRDLVRRKDGASIVFVRMRNEDSVPVYLPLGILAARRENPILDKRIILVEPLPRERYPGDAHPVEEWTFGVPQTLEGIKEESLTGKALKELKISDSWRPPPFRDIPGVRGFLKTDEPFAPGAKPEGFLLLAHQGGGNLWFTDQSNRIFKEHIKRFFPPGSIAILSACSVAAAEGNNQAILEKLNNNGIDAMIISPFPVEANYGTVLAIHFVKTLEEARKTSKGLSIAELFTAASKKTAEHFENESGIYFQDMDLEFLIAGDYRIKVAPR